MDPLIQSLAPEHHISASTKLDVQREVCPAPDKLGRQAVSSASSGERDSSESETEAQVGTLPGQVVSVPGQLNTISESSASAVGEAEGADVRKDDEDCGGVVKEGTAGGTEGDGAITTPEDVPSPATASTQEEGDPEEEHSMEAQLPTPEHLTSFYDVVKAVRKR